MNIKNTNISKKISKLPIGLSGLSLGMAGLGNAWNFLFQEKINKGNDIITNHIIQFILFSLSIIFLFLALYRTFIHFDNFKKDIRDPVLSSFIPTLAMTSMLIGGFISSFGYGGINAATVIGSIIWYLSVLCHFIFLILFIFHIIRKHNFVESSIYASWFVPPIGMAVSCTIFSFFPSAIIPSVIFQIIWLFGFIMFILLFPYILYKIVFHNNVEKEKIPTLAIFGAPPNLLLAGFVSTAGVIHPKDSSFQVISIILVILSVFSTLFMYISFIKIFKTKFNPSYASLTFPSAIGALAMLKFSNVEFISALPTIKSLFEIIAYIELAIATIVISYIFIRYLLSFKKWCI